MEQLLDDLTDLGLSGYEAAVYMTLLGRGGLAPAEVASRARVPRQRVYDVLESLAQKGLCAFRDTAPKTYFAVDPALALETLSQQRAEALERERERTAAKARSLIAELLPVFQAGRGQNDPLRYIEVLSDPDRIAAQALEFARSSQRQVNACIRRPLIISQEQNWRFLREPLARGVVYRALYERAVLDDEELREWMTTFREWGQMIRIVEQLPVKMHAFDNNTALLSMQDPVGGPPSFTAISIRHEGTVAFLNMAFEHLWEQGETF